MSFKFPSLAQWKQIFKVLTKGEIITFLVFFVLAAGSLGFLAVNFYLANTKVVPAFGGIYTEGIVGQPRFINPIYGETDDTDRALVDLVYSGLMTYDRQGNIVPDLAQSYTVSPDGKTYTFTLKPDILWQDGQPLTADDIIYTIQTIQNSDYKSPLRANWIDVDVQKNSDTSLTFNLKQPYNSFLENCTLKIIPAHIWQNISPENFALSSYNLQPVGSGPFEFASLSQDKTGFINTLNLQSNRQYYNTPSYLAGISFRFFSSSADLVKAANSGNINGFAPSALDESVQNIQKDITQGFGSQQAFSSYDFSLPRYFAVFFNNQKGSIFSDANVRKAMTYATDTPALTQKIISDTGNPAAVVNSPILPDFYGYPEPTNALGYNVSQANALLNTAGFIDNGSTPLTIGGSGQRAKALNKKPAFQFKSYLKIGSNGNEVIQLQGCLSRLDPSFKTFLAGESNGVYGTGTGNAVTAFQEKYLPSLKPTGETGAATRQELNQLCTPQTPDTEPLQFTLVTVDQPELVETANLLKNYWQAVGVSVTINAVSATDIKPIIKSRDYDALLYGETLGMQPDLYPFWYSAQAQDPGLNLSSYSNKNVDQLLEDARETIDLNQKEQKMEQLQTDILNDAPALFLYNPDYIYWASTKVQGIDTTKIADPAKRFVNVTSWFLATKRIWK